MQAESRTLEVQLILICCLGGRSTGKYTQELAELAKLPEDERGGQGFEELTEVIQVQIDFKAHGEEERNTWQYKQQGGQGEPFIGIHKALKRPCRWRLHVRLILTKRSGAIKIVL